MRRDRVCTLFILLVVAAALHASRAAAQGWFVDMAFDQSFSSNDYLHSPGGFAASTGAVAVWGPLGFHVMYRDISDGGDDILQDCGEAPAPCVPGTLAVSYEMKSAGLGISYDFVNPTDVMLTLGLTATRNWRTERVEHLSTGARFVNDLPTSYGLTASAHLRLRPLLTGIRPEFTVYYDHSGRGQCQADAACWRGHKAFGLALGFSWVLRPSRQD
ncbi:MAG: hypothetical protein PVJ80_13035 [Gemmatimonadota bacterium]|jgi:hypothetical protein